MKQTLNVGDPAHWSKGCEKFYLFGEVRVSVRVKSLIRIQKYGDISFFYSYIYYTYLLWYLLWETSEADKGPLRVADIVELFVSRYIERVIYHIRQVYRIHLIKCEVPEFV